MRLSIEYEPKGISFQLRGMEQNTFPLDQTSGQVVSAEEWEQLNMAEQLWYDGLLTYDQEEQSYLLPAEECVKLDREVKEGLHLPPENLNLMVGERGNIGRSDYCIYWTPMLGMRAAGKFYRKGSVVEYAGHRSSLTEEQFAMVSAIDQYSASEKLEDRARFCAEIKQLAEKANVKMSQFMQKRDFLFADTADYEVISDDPREIRFEPNLADIPKEIQKSIRGGLRPVSIAQNGMKRQNVFSSPKARDTYNRILQLPSLKDQEVPAFLDNPLAYLPEDIAFDQDLFSERVKGLKIKQSTAVPYVNLTPDPNKPGWFDVDSGFSIQANNEASADDPIQDTPEFRRLMNSAAEAGEKYFFYQDQWVKVDPKVLKQFRKAEEDLDHTIGRHIPESKCRYILDIYENVEQVDYNETLQAYRNKNPEFMLQYLVPSCFAGKLHPHQEEGYGFLCAHYENQTGVLLADDMGLGKTVQIIAFLSYLYNQDSLATALLVMPKSLLDNWISEFRTFLPAEKKIYVHQGPCRYRQKELIEQYDVVMTTYETLARDQVVLGKIQWSCVICDEVQRIKNFRTLAANAVKGMNTKCRIAMTGTPVENRLAELWSIADFAQPGLLGSYQTFRKQYELPLGETHGQDAALASELIQTLSPIFLRRTKDILGDKLPGKHEETVCIKMDSGSEKLYCDIVEEMKEDSEHNMVLATIQKLLMLSSHPRLLTGGTDENWSADALIRESPKLQWTVNQLGEIFAKGEKVILFTKFKKMQAILRRVIFEKFGLDAKIINGEATGNRLGIIEAFSAVSGPGAIILSPRAAGVGLTITAANHVIHYTREWNPAVENQATDRAYRIGQTKPVSVYYPVLETEGFISVESRLDELLSAKRELMKNVIIPADLEIKIEEFQNVLNFSA